MDLSKAVLIIQHAFRRHHMMRIKKALIIQRAFKRYLKLKAHKKTSMVLIQCDDCYNHYWEKKNAHNDYRFDSACADSVSGFTCCMKSSCPKGCKYWCPNDHLNRVHLKYGGPVYHKCTTCGETFDVEYEWYGMSYREWRDRYD